MENTSLSAELAAVAADLAISRARAAVARLTIKDAKRAKEAIETYLATDFQPDHPYANAQVRDLIALVGVPGHQTWQTRFQEDHLPDVVFEIRGTDGHVAIAVHASFFARQFRQAEPEGGAQ